MAVIVTDNRSIVNEADDITGWTGIATLTTADPDPVEATGCMAGAVSIATVDGYVTVSAIPLTNRLVYVWVTHRAALDTLVLGGIGICVGDGTNRMSYHLAGKDVAAFRHDTGPTGWMCLVLDQSNLPTNKTVRLGSEGALVWGSITQIGATFKTLAKSIGGAVNCFIDIIRVADPTANDGAWLTITGGTSSLPGKFSEIAAIDRSIGHQLAHGIIREFVSSLFGVQGSLRFGNPTGTDSSWFEDKNVSVGFEPRGLLTTRYRIVIVDNGVGTTTFKLGTKVGSGTTATGKDGCNLIVPSGVGGEFDAATDTDVTDVFIYGSMFVGFTNGIKLRSMHEFIGCTVMASGTIDAGGAMMVNSKIVGSVATKALLWEIDPSGKLDGVVFTSGGTGYAIEGFSSAGNYTLTNVNFTGYGANETTDAAIHVLATTGTVAFSIVGGNTPTYKSDGAIVTFPSSVTLTMTVKKQDGTPIVGAWAFIDQDPPVEPWIMNMQTIAGGIASVSHTLGAVTGSIWRVRKYGYKDFEQVIDIGSSDISIPVTLVVDPQAQ